MWSEWNPSVIDADLRQLSMAGLQVLRVFPLWPDFQPIHLLRGGAGRGQEFRFGEEPLPDDEIGRVGVSVEMLERFRYFADSAERNGLKLIVGLITGWMSGRLYVPPALERLNVLTDPIAIKWQIRLVRCFVNQFKNHPAVLAWDLGNEVNSMARLPNSEAAWTWTAAITSTIRSEDQTRPIVSGMHSLLPGLNSEWKMQDQAELTDLLTTHPYPYWTPHCDQDPVTTIRTILHSTAESRFYADIGGKPCLAEELGTLGPMLASEAIAADFIRSCLFSLWANDCHGLLWWCSYDQHELVYAPYDWCAAERELGLVRVDGSEKPVLVELGRFRKFIDNLPIQALPEQLHEGICILSHDQDQWGAAYSSYILAKQAGFDLEFQFSDQPIRPAGLYLLPSVCGQNAISRRRWFELLKRVKEGAVLYVSHHDGMLSPFNQPFGIETQIRTRRPGDVKFSIPGVGEFQFPSPVRLEVKPDGAVVLGSELDGNPVFTCSDYGEGKIFFLSVSLELALANLPGAFHAPDAPPYWCIYQYLGNAMKTQRIARKTNPFLGLTEHILSDGRRVLVLVNYSPLPQADVITLEANWHVKEIWYGAETTAGAIHNNWVISPNDALVFVAGKSG